MNLCEIMPVGGMFSFRHTVAAGDVGADGLMRPGTVAMLMQDCSTFQFRRVKKFNDALLKYHMAVFLVSRQVDIARMPAYGEDVEIRTGVYNCKGFYGLRNTTIRDAEGNLCAACFAVGAFVNLDSGKPFVLPKECYTDIVDCEPLPMEYLPRKITLPSGLTFTEVLRDSVVPGFLDANCHLNAGRAFDLAVGHLNYLPHRMRVEYKSQAKPGVPFLLERADISPTHTFMRLKSLSGDTFSTYEFLGSKN